VKNLNTQSRCNQILRTAQNDTFIGKFHFGIVSWLHPDARGGAEGGGYRRKYRDGEMQDFLPKFFLHKLKIKN